MHTINKRNVLIGVATLVTSCFLLACNSKESNKQSATPAKRKSKK